MAIRDYILPTGFRFISLDRYTFAQLPPGFHGDHIPDEFIFNAEWSRTPINAYWAAALK